MKKLLLSFILFITPILAFSQVTIEDFENSAGPTALPSTNWSLSSGLYIDVSHFAKGIYLVEILSESNSKITKKLILK